MMTEAPRIARMVDALAFPGRRTDQLTHKRARALFRAPTNAARLQSCRSFFQSRRFAPHIAVGRCVVGSRGL